MGSYIEPLENVARCRKWKLIVSLGSDNNRKRKAKVFYGSKRQAQLALRDFENETHIPLVQSSFYSFATKWNSDRLASGSIAQATHDKYYWLIHAVRPYLDLPLESIKPSHIRAAYSELSGTWSGTSLRSIHNALLRIFKAAVAEGLIKSSPMVDIDAPKNDTKERKALSPSEARDLLGQLDVADNHHFCVALILSCGLRRKEATELEWRDVGDTIHIRREITKSVAGVRDIPIDAKTQSLIDDRRDLVNLALKSVDSNLKTTDKLCCDIDGRPLTGDNMRRWWERNRGSFGLDGWTLHELRHTYLTNLAQANVHPSIMQRLAGHASMTTTMHIYTHVHNEDMVSAVNSLASLRASSENEGKQGAD